MSRFDLTLVAAGCLLAMVPKTATAFQQASIPIRSTTVLAASDSGALANVTDVRQLPDGRVLVNDRTRRQVIVFDSSLSRWTVVFGVGDSAVSRYGTPTRLLAYGADSSVFVDPEARSLAVVGPAAKIARVMAPPQVRDLPRMASLSYGTAGFDPEGRLVYQGGNAYPIGANPWAQQADTSRLVSVKSPTRGPIVRANFETRHLDTLTWLQLPFEKTVSLNNVSMAAYNPLPAADDWAILSDGTVAVVRSHDYHIDWVHPDGTITSTPKMPFEWRSISIEEKDHIRDSVKAFYDAEIARRPPPPRDRPFPPFTIVDAADLPDYYPPIRQGQVKADPQGNVWVLPSTTLAAGDALLFDVVNREGVVFERVQLPRGRVLVGFGAAGIIYLKRVVSMSDQRLERATLNR